LARSERYRATLTRAPRDLSLAEGEVLSLSPSLRERCAFPLSLAEGEVLALSPSLRERCFPPLLAEGEG
jgi:hypothetical protein